MRGWWWARTARIRGCALKAASRARSANMDKPRLLRSSRRNSPIEKPRINGFAMARSSRYCRCLKTRFHWSGRRTRRMRGHCARSMCPRSRRRGFALALCKACRLIAPRVSLVGDAAHVIHPLAGQGLNLGVRDVAELARTVAAREPFRDPGDPVLLRRYERSRRADIQLLMAATDGLYRLFSWSGAVPRGVRNAGFKLVNAMPRIKRWLASYSVLAPV